MCLAVPGRIDKIHDVDDAVFRSATVAFGSIRKRVNLSMVPDAKEGDYVMVHVGVAISVVDEEEAQKTFKYLRELDELSELEPDE